MTPRCRAHYVNLYPSPEVVFLLFNVTYKLKQMIKRISCVPAYTLPFRDWCRPAIVNFCRGLGPLGLWHPP